MASGMYMLFIRDAVKEPINDTDGNVIFDRNEQQLLLLFHLCNLLDNRDLKNVKLQLISTFVKDNRKKIRSEGDLMCEMLVVTDSFKKFEVFFDQMFDEKDHEFFRRDFLFGKKLNPLQKTLALEWYVGKTKAIDTVFQSALSKFQLTTDT